VINNDFWKTIFLHFIADASHKKISEYYLNYRAKQFFNNCLQKQKSANFFALFLIVLRDYYS